MNAPVRAEIDPSAIRSNLAALRRRLPVHTALCPTVKADAYGHGVRCVLPALDEAGIPGLEVASLAEAVELRALGWCRGISCFAPVLGEATARQAATNAEQAVACDVALTIMSDAQLRLLADEAARQGRTARVDVKVDTGMGRMGLPPPEAEALLRTAAATTGLRVDSVYTHLATADEEDLDFARRQIRTFLELRDRLVGDALAVGAYHVANSAAIFRLPEAHLDRARPGLAMYGYWGGPAGCRPAELRPCMRVVSHLVAVRALPAGHAVGYGRTFVTRRPSRVGLVPIGYADGYRRLLGNKGVMTLEPVRQRGRVSVPVIGRVSMDQTTVDLTEAGDVRMGDPVTIIDDDPASPHSVESLAGALGTIPYEITCLIGPRIERVVVNGRVITLSEPRP